MQASEVQEEELQLLLLRLDEAQQAMKKLQSSHRTSAIAISASDDQLRQADAEKLRNQLESKYGEHLEKVKQQYEARINRLQMQLTGLHAQLQSMEGSSALQYSQSIAHFTTAAAATSFLNPTPLQDSTFGSNAFEIQHAETESAIAYETEKRKEIEREREKENLERRIRQAEARSIALTQQLQSMPASLQVRSELGREENSIV